MSADQQTKYTVYLGKAAADLDTSGTTLKVIVPELTPAALSGTFAPGTTPTTVQMTNISGGAVSGSVTTANHIIAVWEGTSNHAYPPSIKAGEQVQVVQYGDSDRYYWREMGRDRELRKLDHLRLEVSATPSANAAKSDTNTYFIELDAIGGVVQIKTSKTNGEPFAYCIKLDAKNGNLVISDDTPGTPNRIYLDSGANGGVPKIILNNAQLASISLIGPDIIINAPRDIMQTAGRQIIERTPLATMSWNIGMISGTTLGIAESSSMVVTTPTSNVIGNTKVTGMAVATAMRAGAYYVGALGSTPTMPSTAPVSGTGTVGTNTADTQIPGTQRHAAAFEQVVQLAQTLTGYFEQINIKIGVPTLDGTLLAQATASEMSNNAGS